MTEDWPTQWRADQATAYSNGLEDGEHRRPLNRDRATGGFHASYNQGYRHGLRKAKP